MQDLNLRLLIFLREKGQMTQLYKEAPDGYHYIFVKCVRDRRTGKIRYASAYGKKAFKILVKTKI